MKKHRYLKGVTTLELNQSKCTGCGMCLKVCPQGVFTHYEKKVVISDRDACMECSACVKNCPTGALKVQPGVGCATAVLISKISKGKTQCKGCC